jgi:hypothetical protein
MNAIISFFKNKWTKISFSAISLGYGFFMVWLAWLVFSFHLVPTNPVSLFSLYLLINVLFGTVMIYTRKQIATQIAACLLHPCILVMLVFAFGNWFLLIPVFAVSTIVFFAAGSPESLKTVLGTIYLILFVLTVLGYLTLQIFSINIFSVNLELRCSGNRLNMSDDLHIRDNGSCPCGHIHYSEDQKYRLVTYTDKENKENRTISYFIEFTGDDIQLPFLYGERYSNGRKILTQRLANEPRVYWVRGLSHSKSMLYVDGRHMDVSTETVQEIEEVYEFSNETEIFIPSAPMTTVTTTPPPGGDELAPIETP